MYVEQKDRIRIRVRIVPANNDPKRHPRPSVVATEVGANVRIGGTDPMKRGALGSPVIAGLRAFQNMNNNN